MTYDQFLAKYNNKYWDYDGYYGAQCMDLISFYSKELGLPHLSGNAADVANQYPAGYLHVLSPQRGDIVVFARNAANGYAGHIAIYDRPGYYFSQNYPTGSNSHLQYINEPIISIIRPLTLKEETVDTRYEEDWARLAYLYYLGREPSRDERRSRLGQPWDKALKDISESPEAKAYAQVKKLDKQKVIDAINQL